MVMASETPADTTMMRIVHDALRRDLARAKAALAESSATGAAQRRAIGAHLTWMMGFLQSHHASEDDGLYPLVRQRAGNDTAALEVLDRMRQQHQRVGTAVTPAEVAAAALARDADDDACMRATAALDVLEAALLAHLREEEDEAMPIVARLVTAAEWKALEKEHNLDPKSMADLGFEGHWLIDSATDADRAIVLGLVPPIPRYMLLHGFARRYRTHAERC